MNSLTTTLAQLCSPRLDVPDHLPQSGGRRGGRDTLELPIGGYGKRMVDVGVASALILAFCPLFLLLALLVKLSDGGPVFYSHIRVGRNRHAFPCLKFRTMAVNSAELLRRHLAENAEAQDEWKLTQKLKNDPRITAAGRVLRKTSLDELPQLINILRGEMSIVGPRPVMRNEIRKYGQHAAVYFRARPGLTGPWQVSGRNDVSYEARVAFDRYYVENWSLLTDMAIMLRTVPAVLLARGY
jgi:exopolysaccharide production protein ExoY